MDHFHFSSETCDTFVDTRHWRRWACRWFKKSVEKKYLIQQKFIVFLNGLVQVLEGQTSVSSVIKGKTGFRKSQLSS